MKTLSLKVAIGYIIIIFLFIGTSYYIKRQASIFSSSNKLEDSIQSRRTSCDHLIGLVLEADTTQNKQDILFAAFDSINTDTTVVKKDCFYVTIDSINPDTIATPSKAPTFMIA